MQPRLTKTQRRRWFWLGVLSAFDLTGRPTMRRVERQLRRELVDLRLVERQLREEGTDERP